MKTFNNSNELKQDLLGKLQHHQDLDTFIQGKWLDTDAGKVEGNGFKGCFYGCTMQTESNAIAKFSEKYNIDLWYCHITEKIFEGLPKEECKTFPLKSIQILPVGIDINRVKSLYHYRILENQLQSCKGNAEVTKAIEQCMELFKVPFNEIEESAAWSAAESAESAAMSAAESAWSARSAESAAMSAAESAMSAESAAWSARSAARSAESAAMSAESAAWSAMSAAWSAASYYMWLRDTLFSCIKEVYNIK